MTSTAPESSSSPAQQGETNAALSSTQPGQSEVLKSGPLFLSSKGIGWTNWKKRWFVLTRTSLVFFRSDPNAATQRNGEGNLTLGGLDLNSSGSVDVKPDKKLLTVFFPDGREGRAFTLKAETSADLLEWKNALDSALAQAPATTASQGQEKDRQPAKSMVIGRPILLALEEIDGSPSFLEKALKYVEEHGVKTEGILRQAADVELVERRISEYEQGKTEFSPGEDAHIIADCIKYVLREFPSPPVPASCCTALLDAFRKSDRNNRVNNMRTALLETFPEPNRKLMQRLLVMMRIVASHKAVNRMSVSAVAACMAPLLLRPLLAGDCAVENHGVGMDVAGADSSLQLLQAAAAANHAQAIVIILLEEYDKIFGVSQDGGSLSPELFSDSEVSGSESDGGSEEYDDEEDDDEEYGSDEEDEDEEYGSDEEEEDEDEHSSAEYDSEHDDHEDDDSHDDKNSEGSGSVSMSPKATGDVKTRQKSMSASSQASLARNDNLDAKNRGDDKSTTKASQSDDSRMDGKVEKPKSPPQSPGPRCEKSVSAFYGPRGRPRWGRTSARKNLSMESINFSMEDEEEIQRLEGDKIDLENKIAEEAKINAALVESLERQKKALYGRRLALERDVERLEEQLQMEREARAAIEAELRADQAPVSAKIQDKVRGQLREIAKAEENLDNIKQRVEDLGKQVNQQREENLCILRNRNGQPQGRTLDSNEIIKQKPNEAGSSTPNVEPSAKSKGRTTKNDSDSDDCDKDRKHHINTSSSTSGENPGNASPVDAGIAKPTSSNSSKKPAPKAEMGSNNTAQSALSKLTTRLNFLKERRNQIASELQNLDKSRDSPPPPQSDKTGADKKPQVQESGSGKKEDDNQDRKVAGREGSSSPATQDSGGKRSQSSDRGTGQEAKGAQRLDGGRSDSQSSRKTDKTRASSRR